MTPILEAMGRQDESEKAAAEDALFRDWFAIADMPGAQDFFKEYVEAGDDETPLFMAGSLAIERGWDDLAVRAFVRTAEITGLPDDGSCGFSRRRKQLDLPPEDPVKRAGRHANFLVMASMKAFQAEKFGVAETAANLILNVPHLPPDDASADGARWVLFCCHDANHRRAHGKSTPTKELLAMIAEARVSRPWGTKWLVETAKQRCRQLLGE